MPISNTGHTRRTVLAAGVGLTVALTGCSERSAPPPAPDPLQPVLAEALALAAAYERAVVAQPGLAARLNPLAADHRAHAIELARVIGTPPPDVAAATAGDAGTNGPAPATGTATNGPIPATGTATNGPIPATGTATNGPGRVTAAPTAGGTEPAVEVLAGLRSAEQQAQKSAAAACKAAPAERAALVGSIAACRATHAEALR